jgi:hypothetical protein
VVLHNAILKGSELYHELETRAHYYDQYQASTRLCFDREPESITFAEIDRLILFLDQWFSHYESSPEQCRRLLKAIQEVLPTGRRLLDEQLLTVELMGQETRKDIAYMFNTIATCGPRVEKTATSKILHSLHPELFVMWDSAIQSGYAVAGTGEDYAERFLPRVQKIAVRAVEQCAGAHGVSARKAIEILTQCGHTLAKVLDEYNYAKFTLKRDEVWEAELR